MLSKEVLEDKNATTLKQVVRSTAGVTLGTGEGGNAFGDRFFIRGFDARNDVFIDGVRDPGVSVRENFFTEQVEILRGPASSFAGRGTAGGAINIVTKQADDRADFYNDGYHVRHRPDQAGHARRQPGDQPDARGPRRRPVPGRQCRRPQLRHRRSQRRLSSPTTWTPTDAVKITANYIHTDLTGIPDFGVPYYRPEHREHTAGGPFPDFGVNRNNFYGFVNRDFHGPGRTSARSTPRSRSRPTCLSRNKVRRAAFDPELHRHAAGNAGHHQSQSAVGP